MIRCPTCGLEWSPGTLTCPKDGTRLFEQRASARQAALPTVMEPDPGQETMRQHRNPTSKEIPVLGAADVAATSTDLAQVETLPTALYEPRSGPKKLPVAGSLPPPDPKLAARVPVGKQNTLGGGELPRSGPRNIMAAVAEVERKIAAKAAAPLQPMPVTMGAAQRNPWGEEGSQSESTFKRVSDTPKVEMDERPAGDPLIGTHLGEYIVHEPLGQGGMGIVYKGEQPLIGKQVAIKVLRPELASDPIQMRRFLDEARAVNAIRHPGIIDIFSFGKTPDGAQYFVMELLEGQSLEELLHQRHKLKAWEALPILEGALAALDAAHGAGVIHRDLKPSNIFLVDLPDHTHLIKVLDFGLAKIGSQKGSAPLTANVVVGTPEYMAPEQARALEVSARTDIYAMGIVAYEMLTGNVPFTCESAVETLMMQLDVIPKPAGELEPTIPEQLERLVTRMLAKKVDDRPASAAEVKRELGRIKRALTAAETQISQASSVREKSNGTEPGLPASVIVRDSVAAGEKALPPGAARFETTEAMQRVEDDHLEPRSGTDRIVTTPVKKKQRSFIVPLAGLAALAVVAAAAFVLLREKPNELVVPPPEPKPAVALKEPLPKPVERVEPVDPPPVVSPPKPPPEKRDPPPKPPPVVKAKTRTRAQALNRITELANRASQMDKADKGQTLRVVATRLADLENGVNEGRTTPDAAWKELDEIELKLK